MKTRKRLVRNCNHTWEVAEVVARCVKRDPRSLGCKISAYGPFGLASESCVFVEKGDDLIGSLRIVFGPDTDDGKSTFAYRTYETTGAYAPDSIGALNGFNYKSLPLPAENDRCVDLVFSKKPGGYV